LRATGMLSGAPAAWRKEPLADRHRLCLERRAHGVVPAVQKAEGGDHADDLDDLTFAPVLAQFGEEIVRDTVRHGRCGDRKIERDALAFGKERAGAELPYRGELLLLNAEMQRAVSGVRHAVLAAGGTARDVGDEALEAAVDFALRIPDRAEQLRQRLHQLGFSLHDEQAVRHEAEVLRDRFEVLLELGGMRGRQWIKAHCWFHLLFHDWQDHTSPGSAARANGRARACLARGTAGRAVLPPTGCASAMPADIRTPRSPSSSRAVPAPQAALPSRALAAPARSARSMPPCMRRPPAAIAAPCIPR